MDGASYLRAEDLVDEAMLFDAATSLKGHGGDGCTKMIPAAGVILDLGVSTRDGGFDPLLDVLGGGHCLQE